MKEQLKRKKLTEMPDNSFKPPFILWAYRWGCKDKHSYPVGIYKDLNAAKHNAFKEANERGGKYSTVIYATRKNHLFEIYEVISPYQRNFQIPTP